MSRERERARECAYVEKVLILSGKSVVFIFGLLNEKGRSNVLWHLCQSASSSFLFSALNGIIIHIRRHFLISSTPFLLPPPAFLSLPFPPCWHSRTRERERIIRLAEPKTWWQEEKPLCVYSVYWWTNRAASYYSNGKEEEEEEEEDWVDRVILHTPP